MNEGIPLLIMGMGTVFSFLLLLVGCMAALEKLLRPWADADAAEPAEASSGFIDMEQIAVAILAAAQSPGEQA